MRLQHATWLEVEAHLERSTAILIPLGSTEQHGPDGVIGTDALVAEAIAGRAAAQDDDILVAPTLAYAPAQFNLAFAGTVSVRAATFARIVEDVVDSLAAGGFTAFYFLNGHGANIAPVRCACHDLHQRRVLAGPAPPPLRFRLKSWWELPETDALRRSLYGAGEGMHATPNEISITRALATAVFPERTTAPWSPLPVEHLRELAGDAHEDARVHRAMFPDGRVGSDSALSSAEHGEELLAAAPASSPPTTGDSRRRRSLEPAGAVLRAEISGLRTRRVAVRTETLPIRDECCVLPWLHRILLPPCVPHRQLPEER